MCAQAISFARLRRVYWGASDPKGGGIEQGPRIFDQPTCHHRPELYPGVGEREAGSCSAPSSESGGSSQRCQPFGADVRVGIIDAPAPTRRLFGRKLRQRPDGGAAHHGRSVGQQALDGGQGGDGGAALLPSA